MAQTITKIQHLFTKNKNKIKNKNIILRRKRKTLK